MVDMSTSRALSAAAPAADRPARPARRRDPEATRAAIIDGALGFVEQHGRAPTAKEIATQAGVSERSVFVHFADLDELRRAVGLRQAERWKALAAPIDPGWPLERRVEALLDQRCRMYELMTPVRRVGLSEEGVSSAVASVMAAGDAWFRADVSAVFAGEAAALPAAQEPGGLLDAVDAAVSWAAWDHLRHRRGLSAATTSAVLRRTVLALLA